MRSARLTARTFRCPGCFASLRSVQMAGLACRLGRRFKAFRALRSQPETCVLMLFYGHPAKASAFCLSFFSEVCKAKACGGLILALLAQGNNYQYYQSYYIRQHLIQLLYRKLRACRYVEVQYVESAEEYGSQHAYIRTPYGEYNQRYGEPAAVAEGIV